jgi:hypothetical protein
VLPDLLADADVLGDVDWWVVTDLLGEGEVLADDEGLSETGGRWIACRRVFDLWCAFLDALALCPLACPADAAVSTACFGSDEHAALAAGAFATSTANTGPSVPKLRPTVPKLRKISAVSMPSPAGLTIRALT